MTERTIQNRDRPALQSQIVYVLSKHDEVLFAYLYGSILDEREPRDVDVALLAKETADFHRVSSDLKIELSAETGLSPDFFDIRILNGLNETGDLFGLLYLKNVLSGRVLVDRDPEIRSAFLELYGSRYRECEGLIREVLA